MQSLFFMAALLAQEPQQLPPDGGAYILGVLRGRLEMATAADIVHYHSRLQSAYAQLPREGDIRLRALRRLVVGVERAGIHFRTWEAVTSVERKFYRATNLNAVEKVEFEFHRASKAVPPSPASRSNIEAQLDRLSVDANQLLLTRIHGTAARDYADFKARAIPDELKHGIGNPFWGILRPLEPDEYSLIIRRLETQIQALPLIKVDRFDPDTDFWEFLSSDSPFSKTKPPEFYLTDPMKRDHLVGKALEPLYEYSRFNRPRMFELSEEKQDIHDEAGKKWQEGFEKRKFERRRRLARNNALRNPWSPKQESALSQVKAVTNDRSVESIPINATPLKRDRSAKEGSRTNITRLWAMLGIIGALIASGLTWWRFRKHVL